MEVYEKFDGEIPENFTLEDFINQSKDEKDKNEDENNNQKNK